jgi:hypothetical protein
LTAKQVMLEKFKESLKDEKLNWKATKVS